jgi:hypothetical protein
VIAQGKQSHDHPWMHALIKDLDLNFVETMKIVKVKIPNTN